MSGEKTRAIWRAWEQWPNLDVEQVADLVSHGWDAAKAEVASTITDAYLACAQDGSRAGMQVIQNAVDAGFVSLPEPHDLPTTGENR